MNPIIMKKFVLGIAIILILTAGVGLIYWGAVQFVPKAPAREISFLPEEEVKAEVVKTEYSAPDFELENIKGEKIKLGDYKNKIIVLTFWTIWNPAAQDQLAILEDYFSEIKDGRDIVLLTVNNMEDKSAVLNFVRRGGYVLPILLDEKGAVGELYEITALPETFFINREGKIKETFIGVLNGQEIKDKVEMLY